MLGNLGPEEIERVLHEEVLGRIGCRLGDRVYVVPVTYAYDGRRIICHSGAGMKIEAMRQHPEVCFQVEHVDDLANWQSVIAWGRFVELHGQEAAVALGLLVERLLPVVKSTSMPSHGLHSVTPPTRSLNPPHSIVYAIELREKSGRFEQTRGR